MGCAHLFCARQAELISRHDLSLILLAPAINEALREELQLLGWTAAEEQAGVHRITGPSFTTWGIECDPLAGPQEPVLTLFSRVFLRQRRGIIEQLTQAGFGGVLYYMLQQIQQFQAAGEPFMIQHKDVDLMNDVAAELRASILEAIPAEERLRGLPAEEVLRHYSLEQRLAGLSQQELAQLRRLLESKEPGAESSGEGVES